MLEDLETTPALKLRRKLLDSEIGNICAIVKKRIEQLTGKNPVASVIVPAYNEEMYIFAMLDYLMRINTIYPLEFIGVDNSSTDRTGDILNLSGFKCIREDRKGTSYARQAGLLEARGEYIFTTDADTRVPSTWIDSSIKYFLDNQDVVCLSGGVDIDRLGAISTYYLLKRLRRYFYRIMGKKGSKLDSYPGANSVFKRDVAMKVGGYEPGSDMGEDNILAQKMGKHGQLLRIYNDASISVSTSGRRVSNLGLLFQASFAKIPYMVMDFHNHSRGKKISDVR